MTTLIQAYWDIASRRLIDNVCMCIEKEFSACLVKDMETQSTLFGISLSQEEAEAFMQEDPVIAVQRSNLARRIEELHSSSELLENYYRVC